MPQHPQLKAKSLALAVMMVLGATYAGSAAAGLISTGAFTPVDQKVSGAPLRVMADHITVHVASSGLYTETKTKVIQLLAPAQQDLLNPYQIRFDSEMSTLKVTKAWVTTPTGQSVDIPPSDIFVRPEPVAAGAPMFSHAKVVSVVLPKLGAGDELHIITEKQETTPYFPGQYSNFWEIPESQSTRDYAVKIVAPKTMHLKVAQTGGWTLNQQSLGKDEVFTARMAVHHARYPGPDTVGERQFSPLFEVTSFPSWAAVGTAYWQRANPQAAVTPLVQKTANGASAGLSGWSAEKALFDWDSRNIRYVGLELGVGGFVPIAANTTIATRYGDCKAHSTLLQALFNAKHFALYPTIINWDNVFSLPPLPTPFWFNHAIDYAPHRHLFLDSTGEYETPGQLAVGERSKPTVVTGPHPHIVVTPGAEPASNHLDYVAQLVLKPDGTLTGKATLSTKGWWAWAYREIFASIPPAAYGRVMSLLLAKEGGGTGTFAHGNPNILDKPFHVQAIWFSPAYASMGQHVAIRIPAGPYIAPGLGGVVQPVDTLSNVVGPASRQHPVTSYLGGMNWTTQLQLPPGYQAEYLLPSIHLHNAAGSFRYTMTDHDNQITAHYVLRLKQVVYSPQEYPALRKLLIADYTTQKSPIVLEKH